MWRAIRWIMDVLTFARDKQGSNGVLLKDIWTNASSPDSPEISTSLQPTNQQLSTTEINRISPTPSVRLLGTEKRQIRRCSSTSRLQISHAADFFTVDSDIMNCGSKAYSAERLGDSNFDNESNRRSSIRSSFAGSLKSFSSADIAIDNCKLSIHSKDSSCSNDDESETLVDGLCQTATLSTGNLMPTDVLRVYADYETGLPSGYSVLLYCTPLTTAKDVVVCTVKQLNTAVRVKGKQGPFYDDSQVQGFCLVATVGARERCLSDDFQPMKLQGPWLKGKLYVRRKSNLLDNGEDN